MNNVDNIDNELQTANRLIVSYDEVIPLTISDITSFTDEWKILNWHEALEINHVLKGSGNFRVGKKDYTFKQGDVLIISNRDTHLAYNNHDVTMRMLVVNPHFLYDGFGLSNEIETLIPYWEFGANADNLLNSKNAYFPKITALIDEIHHEFHHKENAYKTMLKSQVLKLSAYLMRYLKNEGFNFSTSESYYERYNNYTQIEPACRYIKDNFANNIRLSDIAGSVNMSSSYFSMIFKKALGLSPIEYLIRERVSKASSMLLETDKLVITIAQDCGFSSMSNFLEMFKRYTDRTPNNFRKFFRQ